MIKKNKPKIFYGYIIVLAAFTIMLFAIGGNSTFGVFFKPVLVEFGWTRAMTSGAFSLRMLLGACLAIVVGRLNDRFGPRLLLTVGGLLLGLGYILMSQATTVWHLYLFFGVMVSFAMSGTFVPLISTVARWFSKRRALMTGIVLAGMGSGTMIVPLLVGWLIDNYGWRASFVIFGWISLVFIVLVTQLLRRDPGSKRQLAYGENELKEGQPNADAIGFSLREAISMNQLWLLCASYTGIGFSVLTITVHIVIYATGLGIESSDAVTILAIIGGLNIAGRLVVGVFCDRLGNNFAMVISIIVILVALIWLQFAKELWTLYLFAALFGFAWGGSGVPVSPIIAEIFGMKSHGVLLGISNAAFTIGGVIGPVLAGYIYDVTSSYQIGFLICALMIVISLIMVLLLNQTNKDDGKVLFRTTSTLNQ